MLKRLLVIDYLTCSLTLLQFKEYKLFVYCNIFLFCFKLTFYFTEYIAMVTTRSRNGILADQHEDSGETSSKNKSGDTTLSLDERSLLVVVFVSLMIDLLAFTVILPLLPSLLDYYGSKEVGTM